MADTSMTIDDADEREELNGEEYLPSSYDGEPYKISTDSIKELVIAKLEEMSSSIAALGEDDCVFATIADGFHKPTVAVVVQSVYSILMGKAAASSLTDATVISVDQPVTASGVTTHVPKTTTLADLAAYVAAEIGAPTFDVHALTSTTTPLSDADETPLAQGVQQGGTTVWSTLKTSLSALATYVIGKLRSAAAVSTAAIDAQDEMMIFDKTNHQLKRATVADMHIGTGTVSPFSSHTANTIPTWHGSSTDGDDTLTPGVELVTSFTSVAPSDDKIPSTSAVVDYCGTMAKAPATNTDDKIPQWNGDNSKTLKDGLSVVTSVSSSSTDSQMPTAKAVYDLGQTSVKGPQSSTDGTIPLYDGTNGRVLKAGLAVVHHTDATPSETDKSVATYQRMIATISNMRGIKVANTLEELKDSFDETGQIGFHWGDTAKLYFYLGGTFLYSIDGTLVQ